MIRKLGAQDHDRLMDYLADEAAVNLFIIGDIENFGYESDFQDVWADFDENDGYRAVLLRYYDSFILYSKGSYDAEDFARFWTSMDLRCFKGRQTSRKRSWTQQSTCLERKETCILRN